MKSENCVLRSGFQRLARTSLTKHLLSTPSPPGSHLTALTRVLPGSVFDNINIFLDLPSSSRRKRVNSGADRYNEQRN